MLSNMILYLTIIISVYCCIRLMEMMSSNAVSKLTFRIPWALLCGAGIAIIACCCIATLGTLGAQSDSRTVGEILALPEPLSRP